MASDYSRSVLKVVVAQICQTIGWHSINSTPLEFMIDLLQEYILRVSKLTHQYAEVLGRTEANLDDLGLAFRHMNIDYQELAEYVRNVDSVPCAISAPKFPLHRENHLNFLKPGSREVVTRPVHVHEHLPAMYPGTEEYEQEKNESLPNGTAESPTACSNGPSPPGSTASPNNVAQQAVFKRPGDPISFESPVAKRAKVTEEGRPFREILSVIMTTSGFLSPAREGKLPEARTPQQVRADSPPPYPMVPPELKCEKKPKKVVRSPEDRKLDKENKKKNRVKELFKPDKPVDDSKVKKLASMKELAKLKPLKPGGGKSQGAAGPSSRPSTPKLAATSKVSSPKLSKGSQGKAKAEKIVSDSTGTASPAERKDENVDKLPSEPDKQKLNIFKKISKPREDKDKDTPEQHKHKDLDSRESSPGLIIDENNEKHRANDADARREEKKTPHTPDVQLQPDGDLADTQTFSTSDVYIFDEDYMSPPGTPSTPKTPEVNVPAPVDQKKKKKEKGTRKREPKLKSPKTCVSPKKTSKIMNNDPMDVDIPERPRTPQAPEPPLHREPILPPTLPFPFFPAFPPAPGLIPHPMFPRFPLPLGRGGPGLHPAMPNLPLPPRFLPPTGKFEDFAMKGKSLEREKALLPPTPQPQLQPPQALLQPPPPQKRPPSPLPPQAAPPVESIPMMTRGSEKMEKEKSEKITRASKQEKEVVENNLGSFVAHPVVPPPAPVVPVVLPPPVTNVPVPAKNAKAEKAEKADKKSKEHKKEKKDKLKKKKDKKEKHKEKGEKVKEKKEKGEKKEKVEKIKEKKEKREKRKEKDKDEKGAEGVPKITLKLGPSSPRPPTPDSSLMKKITIKPVLKKPDDETKREPSPELAKISALVTRPPKQKSASKKTEEGTLDASPALPTDTSFSTNLTSVPLTPNPRNKKSYFKNLSAKVPSPSPNYDLPSKAPSPPLSQPHAAFYFNRKQMPYLKRTILRKAKKTAGSRYQKHQQLLWIKEVVKFGFVLPVATRTMGLR